MGLALSRWLAVENTTTGLYILIVIAAIILPVVRNILYNRGKSLVVWRILCFIPFVLCIIHFAFHTFGSFDELIDTGLSLYGTMYLASALLALLSLFGAKRTGFHIYAPLSGLLAVVCCLYSFLQLASHFPATHDLTYKSYTDAYRSAIDIMKSEYVTAEWKQIDFDAIDRQIYPLVEKAEQDDDPLEYYIAMTNLAYLIPDGHVYADLFNIDVLENVDESLAGNDYGFILYRLENGETDAFMVDEDSPAYRSGIKSGTRITSWDGVPIEEAIENTNVIYTMFANYPVAANESFVKPIYLAGQGGDEISVGFIDESGSEQSVKLSKIGSYAKRLNEALYKFTHFTVPASIEEIEEMMNSNFSTKMLTDNCGYLKINGETYDDFLDIKAYVTGQYPEITEMLKEKLTVLRNQGMTRLVIDLRNNGGGSSEISAAVTSLFTKETRQMYTAGGVKGADIVREERYIYADGSFSDIDVIVLTNMYCASAGDELVKFLSTCDNVTTMGISHSNCSAQYAGGACYLPGGTVLYYPIGYTYDETGTLEIDTDANRQTRIPLDAVIPVTKEAARDIFENGIDYELDYAVNYQG